MGFGIRTKIKKIKKNYKVFMYEKLAGLSRKLSSHFHERLFHFMLRTAFSLSRKNSKIG